MSERMWLRGAALLADLDGTLVDSRASVVRGWTRWAQRRAPLLEGSLAELLDFQAGRPAGHTIARFAPSLSADDAAADGRAIDADQAADSADARALPGVAMVLGELVGLGARWAVVTSADQVLARARLAAAGLPEPGVLVTADEVGRGKPDPEGYLIAAARLGVRPQECLVAEDSASGVAAGAAAGARVLLVDVDGSPETSPLLDGERVVPFRWADVVDVRGGPEDLILHLR